LDIVGDDTLAVFTEDKESILWNFISAYNCFPTYILLGFDYYLRLPVCKWWLKLGFKIDSGTRLYEEVSAVMYGQSTHFNLYFTSCHVLWWLFSASKSDDLFQNCT
jgi:hypothetical protein